MMTTTQKLYSQLLVWTEVRANNQHLGLARILFFTIVFFSTALTPLLKDYSMVTANLYCSQTMGAWLQIHLDLATADLLFQIYRIALLFAIVGFLTPASYWVIFLSSAVLNMNSLKFCYFDHRTLPLQAAFFLWALLDTNSNYRLDQKLFKWKAKEGDPSFLFRMMRIHFAIIFFAAGVAKLRYGGIDWITTNSLQNYLILQNFFFEDTFAHRTFQSLNHWVINQPWLCHLLAFETVVIELLAPLALVNHKSSRSIVMSLLLMQIGIYFLMFFKFTPWLALYVFWIPFSELKSRTLQEASG